MMELISGKPYIYIYIEYRMVLGTLCLYKLNIQIRDLARMGFDYGPEMYDRWHAAAPNVPLRVS